MTPLLYAALLALPLCGQPGNVPPLWRTDFDAAVQEAKAGGQHLIVDFGTADCVWCRKLEAGPMQDPAVLWSLSRFVCVKVDAGKRPDLAGLFQVRSYPTLLRVRPDGATLRRQAGYLDAPALVRWLRD